jgi:hypothetical protein
VISFGSMAERKCVKRGGYSFEQALFAPKALLD